MPATHTSASRATTRPGSQAALRTSNQERIVRTLLRDGSATQAELARRTGLSTATVSNIVRTLVSDGVALTSPTTSSGRRALQVSLADANGVAVGIDFGRSHLRVAITSLAYTVRASRETRLPGGYQAAEGIAAAGRIVNDLLAELSLTRAQVRGIGVGIPGPINHATGMAVGGAIHPEWVGVHIHDEMRKQFEHPIFVDNDCNLGALAEVTWGRYRSVQHLVFVKIGTGVGAGLILNGRPYYGGIGVTGEIGHTSLNDQGAVCRCGNRGCLETVASTKVILELLSGHTARALTTADVVEMALSGHPATLRVLDDAGAAIGRALGSLANLINPEVIVIGGPLSGLGEVLTTPIRRGLRRYAIPVVGDAVELAMTDLGVRAEALGAATLVIQQTPASLKAGAYLPATKPLPAKLR